MMDKPTHSIDLEGIGTHFKVEIFDQLDGNQFLLLQSRVAAALVSFETTYSRFKSDSFIQKLSKKSGDFEVGPELVDLLRFYQQLYTLTKGKFTPLIGQALNDAGYDHTYSFKSKPIRDIPDFNTAVEILGATHIKTTHPIEIDLGGVGKGYVIDKIDTILSGFDCFNYCIDGSGDILYKTNHNDYLSIGLEHPLDHEQVIGVINIRNQALCGSSGSRRSWGKFHHIIDPITKKSPTHIIATWVLQNNALDADALATCLFLTEPEELSTASQFNYFVLNSDLTYRKSDGFEVELFT